MNSQCIPGRCWFVASKSAAQMIESLRPRCAKINRFFSIANCNTSLQLKLFAPDFVLFDTEVLFLLISMISPESQAEQEVFNLFSLQIKKGMPLYNPIYTQCQLQFVSLKSFMAHSHHMRWATVLEVCNGTLQPASRWTTDVVLRL